jgi:hypothetical protein
LPEEQFVTGGSAGDIVLGIVLGTVLGFLFGLGIIVNPILYFCLRKERRSFAQGFLIATAVPLLLILGLFAICFLPLLATKVR